jgi:hypothetical protein
MASLIGAALPCARAKAGANSVAAAVFKACLRWIFMLLVLLKSDRRRTHRKHAAIE